MKTNPYSGYPKDEVMDNITNMNTNRSSGYPKEEMMNNITKMNTNPYIIMKTSSKVEHFWDLMASSVRMSLYCSPFQFEDA
jgi:hypothetical protein